MIAALSGQSKGDCMKILDLPKDFRFGAASASYQIEGAIDRDGKGPSIWDDFAHKKGKIRFNQNADRACEHYDRYKEDVALMKELSLDSYRFSIAWSRIMPEGEGKVNEKGLDFYKRLTDELLEKGITPYATLFHWDLPLALQKKYKGFANRKVADLYADYAEVMVKALGDRVKNWMTINEPWEYSCFGHLLGKHAPGRKSFSAYFHVMHNLLLGHGKAVQRIRQVDNDAKVGIVLSMTPIDPVNPDSAKDRKAAHLANQFFNDIALSPLYRGEYPQPLWNKARLFRPKIQQGDMDIIQTPTDFLGLNYYSREKASWNRFMPIINANITGEALPDTEYIDAEGKQRTSMGWEIYPKGMEGCLDTIRSYTPDTDIFIAETGAAFDDVVTEDGKVHDPLRIEVLESHLEAVARSIKKGSKVKGCFLWSLTDNFEWAGGFTKRFGLIHVDYETQRRIIKDSGYWYRQLIEETRK